MPCMLCVVEQPYDNLRTKRDGKYVSEPFRRWSSAATSPQIWHYDCTISYQTCENGRKLKNRTVAGHHDSREKKTFSKMLREAGLSNPFVDSLLVEYRCKSLRQYGQLHDLDIQHSRQS